ncbi:energy-coupling factor transporter transmembrane component T family protein [Bartonella sp. A05]|uniref:energy-coupling factor transporter transmembrane component T family protein n=1 Tax=Bartonella sp. A05 TaxID=2967261 RepID=UPI0022A9D262|nr:energy-coupling factor transporter transmembrane protein EcfT [Bartonella sp. A05]MCZ2203326.1 energy-coupling factor transporter transmembrane protein EcfT [Bartonella sp. A05]
MIGLYFPQDTLIHKLRPGIKLFILIVFGTIIFMVQSILILLLFSLLVALLYEIAKVPFKTILRQLKGMGLFLIFIFVVQAVCDSYITGFLVVLRFIILVLLASLISLTTKVSDMVASIEAGFRPFWRFGINSSKLSIVLSMAIRFIPVVSEKFNEVREAQRARGFDTNIAALAVPLIIRMIGMASEIAEALDARSYDTDAADETLHDDNKAVLKE